MLDVVWVNTSGVDRDKVREVGDDSARATAVFHRFRVHVDLAGGRLASFLLLFGGV